MAPEISNIILSELYSPGAGRPRYLDGERQINPKNTQEVVRILREALEWPTTILAEQLERCGVVYTPPELVIADENTFSPEGASPTEEGPFYCPVDNTIYIDPNFFKDQLLKLESDHDIWAITIAYVILHEIGHHIQMTLGQQIGIIPEDFDDFLNQNPILEDEPNLFLIAMELQADCISGMLMNVESQRRKNTLEQGDRNEVEEDAADIGDDVIMIHSHIPPMAEYMTHGTAKMRRDALKLGLTLTDVSQVPGLQHFINIAREVYDKYHILSVQ